MNARGRAEAGMALAYLVMMPVVLLFAGFVQILVIDWTWHPGVPHALGMLSGSLPAVLTGAFLYMGIRAGLEGSAPGVPLARAPVRLAPVLLAAAAFTALGMRLLWNGAPGLNGLVVLPALTFWGAAAGEWVVHRWLTRGRDPSALVARFFFFSAGAVAWLMIAGSFLNTPRAELEVGRGRCTRLYAEAHTAEDSAMVDHRRVPLGSELGERTCAQLRSVAVRR